MERPAEAPIAEGLKEEITRKTFRKLKWTENKEDNSSMVDSALLKKAHFNAFEEEYHPKP